MRVHRIDHFPPCIGILVIARHQRCVGKPDNRPRNAVAVLATASYRIHRAETPAVGVEPPLPFLPADFAVQIDEARYDSVIEFHPIEPGIHIVGQPLSVLRLAGGQIGHGRQCRRHQVQEMVAHHVAVFLVVIEKLLEIPLVMLKHKASGIEGIADPIGCSRFPQQRPLAAVDHAANQLEFCVIIRRIGVFAHVKAGKTLGPFDVFRIGGNRQHHAIVKLQPFAMMHPVRLCVELLIINSISPGGRFDGFGFRVLPDQTVVPLLVHPQDFIGGPQCMQFRPAIEILKRIIRTIVGAPTYEALQVSFVVKIFLEELSTGGNVVGQELACRAPPNVALPWVFRCE